MSGGRSARRVAQKLLLVGFGLAFVFALEVALRVVGLGGYPPLLVPLFPDSEDPAEAAIYELNPLITEPFFARLGPDGWDTFGGHLRERVTLPKPDGTVRVLFLGASSVEGFPLPRNLTTARFLERMLSHALASPAISFSEGARACLGGGSPGGRRRGAVRVSSRRGH
jgi:hypothetical protein